MSAIFDDEKPEAYHWRMNTETRIDKLEADEAGQTADLALIKANYATKNDITELKIMFARLENLFSETKVELKADIKVQIAEAKTSIILWTVTAVFLAQLLPALVKLLLPS
ncbi:hypothetical protein GTP46_22550 [Duganella sp. FT135W]|uniref:DUF1640 domain-containing protein n=1 Tax=Duganella flavida TaxID=2692175 RepID=A0A6L8KHX5_9BURK|nr:hypothetical protein [Duganella flavida]MYM25414.1 hypothetical protein [Duganella flavida]